MATRRASQSGGGGQAGASIELSDADLKDIKRAIRNSGPAVRKAVRKEMKAVGTIVADEMKRRAPVKTGSLKRKTSIRPQTMSVRIVNTATAYKGRNRSYRYGKHLEFDPKFAGRYAFFYPAIEAKKAEAGQQLSKVLDEVARAWRQG